MDEFKHALPYDPIKAHEYYLRTRHLKGRKPAQLKTPQVRSSQGVVKVAPKKKGAPVLTAKQVAAQQEAAKREAEARVKHLKAKLAKLRNFLRELINKAQGRTVVDSHGKLVGNKTTAKKSSSGGSTKLTAAQKRDAAAASKKYRQTHKQQITLKQQEDKLRLQIADVEKKIDFTRKVLKAAVVNARKKVPNRQ